ncbi:transposase [Cenarchaeum symbiosum A]|uniref:Transposase n=1 Tax=Cenarchaeum symbiosum (strain A) TaxID=414004 RepID=A0RX71_CENSY|nr:transposase [Cenarchaeum symbiosum A]
MGEQPVPPEKSRKREWVRHECKYSNAMWHADWHIIKDPDIEGLNLMAFMDDASRCIAGWGIFDEAAPEKSVHVLRHAIELFGKPASMLPGKGPCFTAGKGRESLFEDELGRSGISLAGPRPGRPQIGAKLGRFFRTFEMELPYFEDVEAFMEHYNERRIHTSLDVAHYEVPLEAFRRKRTPEGYREAHPRWMEEYSKD